MPEKPEDYCPYCGSGYYVESVKAPSHSFPLGQPVTKGFSDCPFHSEVPHA